MNNSSNRRPTFSPLILTLLCCCTAIIFSSCSKKASNSIVGKWEVPGEKSIIEFKPDGTMTVNSGGKAVAGKYSFSDETHMKMEIAIPKEELPPGMNMPDSMTSDCVVKINGDSLDMDVTTNIPGQAQSHKETSHLKRIK